MPRDGPYRLVLCPNHRPHVGLCPLAFFWGLVRPALDPLATRASVPAVVANTPNKPATRHRIVQAHAP